MSGPVPVGPDARAFVCGACGAPGWVSTNAAPLCCAVCSAPIEPATRYLLAAQSNAAASSSVEEASSPFYLGKLRAQSDGSARSPYTLTRAPPGYEELARCLPSNPRAPALVSQALVQARKVLPSRKQDIDPAGGYRHHAGRVAAPLSDERTVVWIASRAVEVFGTSNQWARARPWVEQALDLVGDEGLQHWAYTQLATIARGAGNTEAAWQWLAQCSPTTGDLELDSAYRTGRALLLADRWQWAEVLEAVGERRRDVPISLTYYVLAGVLRVAAHEGRLQSDAADRELAALLYVALQEDIELVLVREAGLSGCRDSFQRHLDVQARRAAIRRRAQRAGAMVIVGMGLGAFVFGPFITWSGRSTVLSCSRPAGALQPATPSCSITRTIAGSKVEGFELRGLSDASVKASGSGNKRSYRIELRTLDGIVDMYPISCSRCGSSSNQIAQNVRSFLQDQKRESMRVTSGQQSFMQLVGIVVGFLGLGCIMVGVLKALSTLATKMTSD